MMAAMKITFFGASGGVVTGSAYLVETDRARILVDFGQFQGGRKIEARNRMPVGLKPSRLDAVLLTHGHLDHCGRLPLLAKRGYRGKVLATAASTEMAGLILRDAAKIQLHETERTNRKRERAGQKPVEPLFTREDAEAILECFRPAGYEQTVEVAKGVTATFVEAGHMLGSSSIILEVNEEGQSRRVIFSGDIGPRGLPILRDAACIDRADLVVMESTYGDRRHRSLHSTLEEFSGILKEAVAARSRLLVPAFAVGRTQQILYHLLENFAAGVVDPFPVFVDSPMASGATEIYRRHPDLFDEEAKALFGEYTRFHPYRRMLKETESVQESIALNKQQGPCIIIAGSGMCTGGRILHHLKHGLWKKNTHVLIVGFQAQGSLGRLLVDGRKKIKIFGETIAVKARVHTLNGFSAHADQAGLMEWFGCLAASKPRLVLTHGEAGPRQALARLIRDQHGIEAVLPDEREVVEV